MKNGRQLRDQGDPQVLKRLLEIHEQAFDDSWMGPMSHVVIVILLPLMAWAGYADSDHSLSSAVILVVVWSLFFGWRLQQIRRDIQKRVNRVLWEHEPEYDEKPAVSP